jgi:hypothetical protein
MNSSVCKFDTVGQHTCEDRRPGDEAKAPFMCLDVNAFLGRGYYFWEDNLQLAKHWGGERYHKKGKAYLVGETPISCDWNDFFDLVGNRQHQKFLVSIMNMLVSKRQALHGWPIGRIIEFLKGANTDPEGQYFGKFTYKVFRAVDDSFRVFEKDTAFAETQHNYVNLNPCYIICVIDQKGIILHPLTIVHRSKKG